MSDQYKFPLICEGKLSGGTYKLEAGVSSQFISGLLLAMPLLDGDSTIELVGKLESAPYVDITLRTLELFGADIEARGQFYFINGRKQYRSPVRLNIGGDYSNAAFFLAMGLPAMGLPAMGLPAMGLPAMGIAVGNNITVTGLEKDSAQGDKAALELLERFGAGITANDDGAENGFRVNVSADYKKKMSGICFDAADIPDLVPVMAIVASVCEGETVITNVSRLRMKESDRIEAVIRLLDAFGVKAETCAAGDGPEGLVVYGKLRDVDASVNDFTNDCDIIEVDSFGDHRIVMAAVVAAHLHNKRVKIKGTEAVRKSYPDFFEEYGRLGGRYEVV